MASSAIKSGALVALVELHSSSPFFKDGTSLRVTGKFVGVSMPALTSGECGASGVGVGWLNIVLRGRSLEMCWYWPHGEGCSKGIGRDEMVTAWLRRSQFQQGHNMVVIEIAMMVFLMLSEIDIGNRSIVLDWEQVIVLDWEQVIVLDDCIILLREYSVETATAIVADGSATLKIDTRHLRDLSFRVGSMYQFIGELCIQPDNEAILQARVGRNVDGLDLNLYHRSLQLLRQFQTDHMNNPAT
ncbi:hypothetical protein JRO89_XS11G0044500 [Xanthoceras sorbifolium]|uniref:CST complex subunit TEN1 n=1 Tax=Xanthoceras sorbifolium TaxID=99658 RepID=A0ABQ8HEN8_9ROSI|nr:hypothetical protein JRO89_XS11G0044500 [Xanthoceras sorbifolium]